MENKLLFLKLGGSLITDKHIPHHAKIDRIDQLAQEIRSFLDQDPSCQLLVGHGSGSFGHVPAAKFKTRQGVNSCDEWIGFSQVWSEARFLNQVIIERFTASGVSVLSFPPSAAVRSENQKIQEWNLYPIRQALNAHLVPVVYGDVIFDSTLGGTILSTEELFIYLTSQLQPAKILITGEEQGVWEDFPTCHQLIPVITPEQYPMLEKKIFGSANTDVTGGMSSKVALMVNLVKEHPLMKVQIFSPSKPGMLLDALRGNQFGTLIKG